MIFADSCILIDFLKEKKSVVSTVGRYGKDNVCINSIVMMELYRGALNKVELQKIKSELRGFRLLETGQPVLALAVQLIERYALSHNAMIPDCIIAASCIVYNMPLWTANARDFSYIPGIEFTSH